MCDSDRICGDSALHTLSQCRHGDTQNEYRQLHHPVLPPCFNGNCPLAGFIADLNDESGVGLEICANSSSNNYE